MFVERLNSKQNVFAAPELREKCATKSEVFTSLPQMTSHKPLLAEIWNISIFHITQYFWVKSYKRNQWNLPNILAYISGIFEDFFKAGLVPLSANKGRYGPLPSNTAPCPTKCAACQTPTDGAWIDIYVL